MMIGSLSSGKVDYLYMDHPGLTNICVRSCSVFHELEDKKEFFCRSENIPSPSLHHGKDDTQGDCSSKRHWLAGVSL